ncbi:MAG TPA: protein kinase [Ktedonobacteraceae bacterium]|nr:protein kinase [Ktedonobacteraceae bacterium]
MPGLEGTTLGRYRLHQRLGEGGMSEVYLAYDELMHRDIAVKVMSNSNIEYIERFQREAEAVGNLHHNHILPAFDYGQQNSWHYLVMPYIEHGSLSDLLDEGPLTLEHAGEMLSQIASALQCAHDHGILHRDIKPSNILLSDDHFAYLADFGLAKPMDGRDNVTHTGVLMGTPEYMAPELADGHASISSDLYALGILLYQMVTGQLPFTGDTPLAVYIRQMHELPAPPSRLVPAIPPDIDRVILRALDKDPRRRFQTPDELAQAYLQAVKAPLLNVVSSNATRNFAESAVASASLEVAHEDKLVLPVYQLHENVVASDSRDKTIIERSSSLTRRSPISGHVSTRKFHDERYNRNLFKVTGYMGISFMLIMMSIILFAVFAYSNNRQAARNSALTAQAVRTHQPVKTNAKQTKATPISHATIIPLSPKQAAIATARSFTNTTPIFADDLSTNFISDWYVDYTNCTFVNNTYHVIVKQNNDFQTCKSSVLSYDNAALQVDVSLLKGSDAGLILRATDQQFYEFGIDNQRNFFFRRHDPDGAGGGSFTDLIPATRSNAILPGKRKNTLLVIANGSNFDLFINGVFVGEYQDSSYASGQVGFSVETYSTVKAGEASFSNFKVYSVSS